MNAKVIVSMLADVTLLAFPGRPGAQFEPSPVGDSHSLESRVSATEAQLAALAPLLDLVQSGRLEVVANDGGVTALRLTGINLQVVNGLGVSAGPVTNGAGNVIIGYDEPRTAGAAACSSGRYLDEASCVAEGYVWGVSWKTGSHYLVVGPQNNYGRTNGIVVGQRNSSSAPFASVLAGQNNAAAKSSASVCGGQWNIASGNFATVSGGTGNTASGDNSTVSGGAQNVASAEAATVSGGYQNTASGPVATVSGGNGNFATGGSASVSAGAGNSADGWAATVSGGTGNVASGDASTVSGGVGNTAIDWGAHVP